MISHSCVLNDVNWVFQKLEIIAMLASEAIGPEDLSHSGLMLCVLSYWGIILIGIFLIVFYSRTTSNLDLDHLVRTNGSWSYQDLSDVPSNTCLNNSQRTASDLSSWGPRFNTHWGNNLLLDFFCFQVIEPVMRILPISAILWKTQTSKRKVSGIYTRFLSFVEIPS